ncbi:hypothetical protein AGR9A_Cc120270 [Agrobacterium salinitolerans str. Hayward 0363]|nr:hypothetical protein AGR9A_Cc120270 [Agrobacterium salinitolerans str. Hayward 0363]
MGLRGVGPRASHASAAIEPSKPVVAVKEKEQAIASVVQSFRRLLKNTCSLNLIFLNPEAFLPSGFSLWSQRLAVPWIGTEGDSRTLARAISAEPC